MTKTAWILNDDRAGNTTQTTALAKALNLDYQLKDIQFNIFAKLPNVFLSSMIHVNQKSKLLDAIMPDVIISAGRKCAAASYALKKKNPELKIVHIMRPLMGGRDSFFDYIILPNHDSYPSKSNVMLIAGALNDAASRVSEAPNLQSIFAGLSDFVGVIIGGNTKNVNFTDEDNLKLIDLINNFLLKTNLIPVITFSRRTPESTKKLIKTSFAESIIYDPTEDSLKPNIYYSILKSAKFIICTGDSISMCSEIASSGKPFYVYMPNALEKSTKHISFINYLLNSNVARRLEYESKIEEYKYTPMNEISRITRLIKL
jgi:hypothetical protein